MIGLIFTLTVSARDLYVQAIDAMANLPQPQYVTYTMQTSGDGLQVDLLRQGGQVWLNVHGGSGSPAWNIRHRTFDYRSDIETADEKQQYVTHRSFFDPTWYGAIRAFGISFHHGVWHYRLTAMRFADGAVFERGATPAPLPQLHTERIR